MADSKPPLWWLPDLIAHLGPPETSPDNPERWTWQGGAVGVAISSYPGNCLVTVWAPDRSVTVWAPVRPSDADIWRLVTLAGLRARRL